MTQTTLKLSRFNLLLISLLTLLCLAIAMPTVHIPWQGTTYTIRGVDPGDLNKNYVVQDFAFQPSLDLQGGKKIELEADLNSVPTDKRPQQVSNLVNSLNKRLSYAGLGSYQLTSVYNDQTAKLSLIVLISSNPDLVEFSRLLTPGEFGLWAEPAAADQEKLKNQLVAGRLPTSISNSDIESVTVISDSRVYAADASQPRNFGLKIVFKTEAADKFLAALYQNPTSRLPLMLTVDEQPIGIHAQGQIFNPYNPGRELLVYTLLEDTAADNSMIAGIISNQPLEVQVNLLAIKSAAPIYGDQALSNLKLGMLSGFILLVVALVIMLRRRALFVVTSLVIGIIWTLAAMKMFSLPLNLSLILGFALGLLTTLSFLFLFVHQVIRETTKLTPKILESDYQLVRRDYRNFTIAALTVTILLQFINFPPLRDFAQSFGFTLLIAGFVNYIWAGKELVCLLFLEKKYE